jgi:hypothetical protein
MNTMGELTSERDLRLVNYLMMKSSNCRRGGIETSTMALGSVTAADHL